MIEKSVMRTGRIRFTPQMKSVSGAVGGTTSMTPAASRAVFAMTPALFG